MTPEEIAAVFRAEYGRAVAVLVRVLGDIDLAEDAVADAFATALQRWPGDGAPPSPAGWIITTARNRAIDQLRRESARAHKHAAAAIRSWSLGWVLQNGSVGSNSSFSSRISSERFMAAP